LQEGKKVLGEMKSITVKDKRYTGSKALLIKIVDNGDGTYDITTNDVITDIVKIDIVTDKGDKVLHRLGKR